jgi:uncharacterized protein
LALIIDTGPLWALLDKRDANHERCSRLIKSTREPKVIPSPVLVEVDYWIQKHLGPDALADFLADIRRGSFRLEDPTLSDLERVEQICIQYRDSPVGFVDAAVLIVERLGETKLATLDHRHFGMLRPRHVEVLTLLP